MTDFEILLRKAGYSVPQAAEHLDYSEGHIYRWIRGEERPRDGIIRLLELEINQRRGPDSGGGFTFIDLFAGSGTFALQAHDPGSTVFYKNLRVKKLD